jgi:hypothetical protein
MHNKNNVLIVFFLLLLPGCFFNKAENNVAKSTFFIQLLSNTIVLASIKEAITPVINGIIKEELGLAQDYDFEFFLPKPQPQRLTLYYVNKIFENGEKSLFSVVEGIQWQSLIPSHVAIAQEVNFFGDQTDELVIMIDDPDEELSKLNQKLKESLHQMNDGYKQVHHHDAYDISKSERFPFVPHIGLGRIRVHSIKQHIKDTQQIDEILGRLKQRIKKETSHLVKKLLTIENRTIYFDGVCIFDLEKRAVVREIVFEI